MTLLCVLSTILICTSLFLFSLGIIPVQGAESTEVAEMSGVEMLDYYTTQAEEEIPQEENEIEMTLPEGVTADDITVECSASDCRLTVFVPGITEDYFYENPLVGSTSHINDLVYSTTDEGAEFEITFDNVFEAQTSVEGDNYYIQFVKPEDLYDKIVVIDPGHGGTSSPGTVRQDIKEADIDLAIGLYLKDLLQDSGIGVYFTRTEDVDTSLDSRVSLANNTNADLFISIHNNANNSTKMDSTTGTEVLYNELDTTGKSLQLAQICEEEVTGVLGSRSRGVNAGSSIYIIRTSKVPVALIEVGFMSNRSELQQLDSASYQQLAAQGIYNAIMRALEEGL